MIMPPDHPTRQKHPPKPPPTLAFAQEVMQRLPLAEAGLALFHYAVQPPFLDALFERYRGRSYEQVVAFPQLLHWLFEALIEHGGSGRQAHLRRTRGVDDGCNEAFYGKLRRLPVSLSIGFLEQTTQRLQQLYPKVVARALPPALDDFDVLITDGKNLKKVAKRLRETRGTAGKLLGGKLLVAYRPREGLVVDMAVALDGERNEASLVTTLLPRLHALPGLPKLIVADRQFSTLAAFAAFVGECSHFVVRHAKSLSFTPDPHRPAVTTRTDDGRAIVEEWGWVGTATHKGRREVRRLTVSGSSEGTVSVLTDLLDRTTYPADALLTVYRLRWTIEGSFQQVTQLFSMQRFVGATAEATVFQAALCFVLANLVNVLQGYVVEPAQRKIEDLSTAQFLNDWQRELTALKELVPVPLVAALLPTTLTEDELRDLLQQLLGGDWRPGWTKTRNKKPRPHRPAAKKKSAHTSVVRRRQAYKKASGP